MDTLSYIVEKFSLDITQRPPVEILPINRRIMAQLLNELRFTTGAEIGVAKGEHAEILSQEIDGLNLYCIDPWEGYSGYTDYLDGRLKGFYTQAQDRLAPYNCRLIKDYSMNAVKQFENDSLDFVYIDGAHDLRSVIDDMTEWHKKVKPGGILYGHDFKRSKNPRFKCHVVDAVQAYTYAHGIRPWFVLGERGHNDGVYREGTRAWMFVKAS